MTDRPRTIESLALMGTLAAVFDGLHPLCDQWVQNSKDAAAKGVHGDHLVFRDGTPVTENPWHSAPTMTASAFGRRAVARHVASYSAVQLAATVAVTRALGYRVPAGALLAGAAINAGTHALIDRRDPLIWLAKKCGKHGYIQHATVVRKVGTAWPEPVQDTAGPGTALMELDQALHRAIGIGAAAVTAWLATRKPSSR
ncbi:MULTISPECIES: hypothetical protein [unclassified Streptomyces]|uniref:hypothetical protein n=1 Tax=unclassified Streptomyces TaxID=2593676 RepID=UPI00081DF22F|nr:MULTISPECIES: hypothetical protein [unclassified Streptomyces]MYZ34353.1 hypothetical protein [Streptomyces sp. SID4917]SCF66708.1 hypothetical protein GA0115259_1008420 [Streptomyces sp. MnatMP-M17]